MEKQEAEISLEGSLSNNSFSPLPSDPTRNRRLVRSIDVRLLTIFAWIYLLNYLDRGNIGNARVLNSESHDSFVEVTNITPTQYSIVLSLFSLAYALFEVPSNWIMKRYVRPSRWLSVLLFGWSAFTLGFAGVRNYAQVAVLRFIIGAFEAGFLPGIVYMIASWYRPEERSVRIAVVNASATLAGAFGGVIAFGTGRINGVGGLEGFRWLFLIEGLVSMLSCLLILLFLPDFPSTARFLSSEDKRFAIDRLDNRGHTKDHAGRSEILQTCFSPRMLAHYFAYLINCIPLASLTFYTPTIVAGLGYSSLTAQLMIIPPWVVGYIVSLALSFSADHFNARGWHVAVASTVSGIGWLTAACLPADAYTQRYGALILAMCGAFPSTSPLTAWVTCNVPAIATVGIAAALNNSTAGVSQIIAQWIWITKEARQGYPTGNITCAVCSFGTAIVAVGLRLWYGRMNRLGTKDASENARVWLY